MKTLTLMAAALLATTPVGALVGTEQVDHDPTTGEMNPAPAAQAQPTDSPTGGGCSGSDTDGNAHSDAQFNESYYLSNNPDVAAAVAKGDYTSGCQHWTRWGWKEPRATHGSSEPKAATTAAADAACPAGFDADYYSKQSDKPDQSDQLLKYWTAKGDSETHLCASSSCDMNTWLCNHYNKWGRGEGRAISAAEAQCGGLAPVAQRCGADFDSSFYGGQNSDVGAVMGKYRCSARTFTDECGHYLTYGQYEMTADGLVRLINASQKHPKDREPAPTAAQLSELRHDIAIFGRLSYNGFMAAPTLVRGPVGCEFTPGQRAANPSLPAPSAFSPGGQPCGAQDVTNYLANGNQRPITCEGPNNVLINLDGYVTCSYAHQAAPPAPVIASQEPQIVAYLVARGMDRGMAQYSLHAFGSCNIYGIACSNYNFRGGDMPSNAGQTLNSPPISLNWLLFSFLFTQTGQGNYSGNVPKPPLCSKTYKEFGCS